jgi:hypothetical protein
MYKAELISALNQYKVSHQAKYGIKRLGLLNSSDLFQVSFQNCINIVGVPAFSTAILKRQWLRKSASESDFQDSITVIISAALGKRLLKSSLKKIGGFI